MSASGAALPMTAPPAVYRRRRARLAAALERPLVLLAGHAPARNYSGNPHPFRAGSSYLYFGGPPVEHAALVIEPGSDGQAGCALLRRAPGPEDALWLGEVPSDAALAEAAGVAPQAVADASRLEALLGGRRAAGISPPFPEALSWAARLRLVPAAEDELLAIIDQRLIKDEYELAAMRRAAEVSVRAHRAALAATRPGRGEADVAAAFEAVLVASRCRAAFSPVITIRGEVLHGRGHGNPLVPGAVLLCDAGAEEPGGYASDITRSYPVSGRWSVVQRELYQAALRALNEALAACVPGRRYRDVHDLSARLICEGLVAAGLLRGEPGALAARGAHALFYPHGLGHLIGLDAHDMEDFGDLAGYARGRRRRPEFGNRWLRLDRDLAPGMTLTVEPGVYLVPAIWADRGLVEPLADVVDRGRVEALLAERFGGIRIEQTICVRSAGGPEVLSAALPSDPEEVAACVGSG